MIRRATRRVPLFAVLLLAIVILTSLPTGSTAAAQPPTRAQPPAAEPAVRPATTGIPRLDAADGTLRLDSINPVVATPTSGLTVTGRIVAPPGTTITNPAVRLVLGPTSGPVTEAALARWRSATGPAPGRILSRATVTGSAVPGRDLTFTLVVAPADLTSGRAYAALPIAVEVRYGSSTEVVRTFVMWQRRKEYVPIEIGWVVRLTTDPEPTLFIGSAADRLPAWRGAIGPGSRIDRILAGTKDAPVPISYLLDPTLVLPATAFDTGAAARAGGAQPPAPPSTTGPTTTTPAAPPPVAGTLSPSQLAIDALHTDLAERIRALPEIWALPTADADIAAAAATDPPSATIQRYVQDGAALARALGRDRIEPVADPGDERVPSADTLHRSYGSTLPEVLTDSAALEPSPTGFTAGARGRTADGIPLLVSSSKLTELAESAATGVVGRQAFLAETLALLDERPGTPRTFLVATPRDLDPTAAALSDLLAATAALPWVTPTSMTEVRGGPAAASVRITGLTSAPPTTLTRARLAGIDPDCAQAVEVSVVLRDAPAFAPVLCDDLAQLASVRWRGAPRDADLIAAATTTQLRGATQGIRVISQEVNFFAEDGVVQVYVANDLAQAVGGLRLRVAPDNPRLTVTQPTAEVRLGPRSRTSVKVRAQVIAAGAVNLRAWLVTADGTVVGQSGVVKVQASPPGRWLYAAIGGFFGVILVLGVVRALRRPRRADQIRVADPQDTSVATELDRPAPLD